MRLVSNVADFRDNYLVRNVRSGVSRLWASWFTRLPLLFFALLIVMSLFGGSLAPYEYDDSLYEDGELLRGEDPSLSHPLGTTNDGMDVLSRVLVGAQPTLITGLLGGALIVTIGMSVGVTAGYVGGRVDTIFMRFTDIAYSVPLIPFAIVLLALLDIGFLGSVVVIGLILWRGSARVLRSQVLQIKERPFVLSAKASGASTPRIIFKHIIPNVAPMAVLFFALGIGWAILVQASLAFIGVSDPNVPSWGIVIRNAYDSGYITQYGWSLVPGILIACTVLSAFLIGREFEVTDSSQALAEG